MKKILTFVLSMMFLMGLMIAPVSAAAGDVAIDASDITAKPGETVTLTFSVKAEEAVKFSNYAFSFQYDPTDLTYVPESAVGAVFNPEYSYGTAFATYATGSNVTYQDGSVLLTAKFTVRDSAKPGDVFPIYMTVDHVTNASQVNLTAYAYDGSVTIVCPGHVSDNGVETTKPTCTEPGVMTYTCTVCGEVIKTEPIDALGHVSDGGKVTTKPTCTEPGVMTFTCTVCGEVIKTEPIDALGHDYADTVTKEATCTKDGVKTYTCTVCGHTYTKAIKATGHKWDEGKVTKAATCDVDGVMTYTCTVCGHTCTEVINALGHNWTDWEVVKAPTKDEWGLEQRTCLTCGEVETREIEPAKDQVPDTGVRSNNYGVWAVAATVVAGAAVAFVWKRKTAK